MSAFQLPVLTPATVIYLAYPADQIYATLSRNLPGLLVDKDQIYATPLRKSADAGQMHLYLNYARHHWMKIGENPPVGLILCSSKGQEVAKYALENLPNKVAAAEYRLALPSEDQLLAEIRQTSPCMGAAPAYPCARNLHLNLRTPLSH